MILCVDDLQWMDEGSLAIYRRIFESVELPVMVIGINRTQSNPSRLAVTQARLAA